MGSKQIIAGVLFGLAIAMPASAGLKDNGAGEFSEIVRPAQIEKTAPAATTVRPEEMLSAAFILLLLDHKL